MIGKALDNNHQPVRPDRRSLGLLLLTILASASFSLFVVAQRFWLDDSFITFRHFRNLFEGQGLQFNAGERVEGYTNFLWGVVGWIGMHLDVEPIDFTQWVSVGAQAVTLLVVYRIGLVASGRPGRALLAPLLLSGQIAFVAYPMTGMETSFFAMLVTLSFHLFQTGEARTRAGSVALGFVLAALCMTRFDGFVLIGILAACPLLARRQWRRLLLPLGMFAVAFVAYNAWRLSYYSTPLPNSFYAKISFSLSRSLDGLDYIAEFFADRQVTLLLALLPFALRRTTAVGRYLGWVVVTQLAYVVAVGGDWMPHHRFILHVLPLLMILAQEGAWQLWDGLVSRARAAGLAGTVLLLSLLAVNAAPLYRGREFSELTGEHFRPEAARAIGRALDRMLPDDMLVAIEWGGILPYYTHHDVLDTFGITNLEIAQHASLPRTIWGRRLGPKYLSRLAPDVIVPCAAIFPTEAQAYASVQPGGKSRYGYYMDMDTPELGYTLKVLQLNDFAYWPVLVRRGRWIAAADAGAAPEPELAQKPSEPELAQHPSETRPYQLSLFWGGGQAWTWEGSFELESGQVEPESEWSWLTDMEVEDSLMLGVGMAVADSALPSTSGSSAAPKDFRFLAPEFGGLIQTETDGDADGLCLAITAEPSTTLVVTFGETRVEWLLSDLAESPATAAIDATGNAIHAVAQRLDSLAPFTRDHHGTRSRRVSLHNHSRFSGNPALNRTLFEGMSVFVREAWWTDHNIGTVRTIVGGDFEDPQLVKRFWWAKQQRAELLHAGRVAESREGSGAYRLHVQGEAGGAAGRAWTGINRAGVPCEPYAPLGARPELRFSWKPTGSTIAFAEVQLASTNLLRYLSARPDDFDPKRDIVLESPADTWTDHVVDLAAGHAALFDGRFSDCFVDVTLGVLCQPGESAEALFDELELITSEPSDLIRVQLNELARSRLMSSYVGMEQSAWYGDTGMGPCFPHLTFLAPGDVSKLFPNVEREPLPADRRAMVEQVQAAGGCVGTHHMQFNEHYFALLEGGGLGIDLFEIGGVWGRPPYYGTLEERRDRDAHRYPDRLVDEVHPLLVRWDRLTARGILLTGYGAPDLNGLFNRPMQHSFNRWLTSILSEDDSSESLLRALRSGRAVASEWRTPALVTLSAGDGLVMGKLVVTDAKRHTLRARVSAAAPGSRLSFVVGPLVRDRWDADLDAGIAPVEASDPFVLGAVDSEIEYEIDTARGCFVRAELRNPAGHLIALGNPVYFLPYWPERWPFGRVAFDWQGVRLGGEDGLLLEDARVDRDGRLVLSGSVFADSGELRVVCPSSPLSVEPSAGSWSWDPQGQLLVLTDLPSGDFTLAATFAEPLATGRTADFTAVPERKQVLARIDVGDPESEAGRLLSGFGDIVVVPALRAYRGVQQSGGEFELPVPVDRSTWLKIQQAPATFSMTGEHPFVACRVLMDGTEIGRIGVFDSPVIEIPPTPSPTGTSVVVRRFSIQMLTNERPAIDVIWLYGGPGVVEY